MNYLHWLDYVVMAALMIVSLGIGIFFAVYRGGQRTKVEYLLGNRQMSMIPVCLSMFITYQSAIALLGVPADVFNTGTMYLFLGCGVALSYIVSLFTAVPLLYPLKITSVNEYLELRFDSKCVRLFATILGMLQTVLYMAMALFSPAIALQTATGLPLWVSIAILGGICTLYTAVGGIKSVVWTDVFQTGVYVIGVGTVIVMCTLHVGSLTQAFRIASEGGRIEFSEINPDVRERHSLWATLIGGCFTMFSGFTQSIAQRISSLKTLKKAKLAFLLSAPINLLNECILTLMGVLLYAYVVTIGCDPYQAGIIDSRNQMMPYFVPSLLGSLPGMPGLYMSMLFSGALSTLSSGINALGANTVEDLLARPLRGYHDATVTVIAKISVLLYGGLTIGLAYLARSIRGPVTQITITVDGACSGSINGIFFMAGMVPWTNKYGAIGGGLIGIAINLWISVGSLLYGAPTLALPPGPTHNCPQNNSYSYSFNNFTTVDISMTDVEMSTDTNPSSNITNLFHSRRGDTFFIYDISYLWLSPIGFFVTLITGIIISFITGSTNKATLDPKLVFPFTRKLFRMNEPPQEAENSSDVIVMKTYQNPAEKCIGSTDTMDEDHLSVQPLM
ncbi:sodium-coupled monocarboxylate transporter 1-like [Pomacea canaliculata]|uniref:sodium-coupled monocarboxylate transporter 1-like n=1 Tax=Pomacea canaliculata TaxID=400727 RepID=UPI000D7395ED|nr:sodium-coupled monocarboxylate transporter 1-like [Pomacea canaliculata]